MIGFGELVFRAFLALWRTRWTILPLIVFWLAVDGLFVGYLNTHGGLLGRAWIQEFVRLLGISDGAVWLIIAVAGRELPGDVVRAVFVVLTLRALLKPLSGPSQRGMRAIIVPMALVLLFEAAWSAILWPLEEIGILAMSVGLIDRHTAAVVIRWAPVPVFVLYSLAMSRLCFAYPNAVLGLDLRIRQSWHDTRGLALPLFLAFLAAAALFVIIYSGLRAQVIEYVMATDSYEFAHMYMQVVRSVREVPRDVLTLAMIAVAYAAATGAPAGAISGTGVTNWRAKSAIGQLASRAIAALWRRRYAALGLMLAWLALDVLLYYLFAFHPISLHARTSALAQFVDREWLQARWFQIVLLLPYHYLLDLIRTVFVLLLLRTLLLPLAGPSGQAKAGLIVPFLLILVFEVAWTTVLVPVDQGLRLAVSGVGSIDSETAANVSVLVRVLIFVCYALAMSRLCFVYPNATFRRALSPKQSWRDTSALAARLFVLFLAIPIPFFALARSLGALIVEYGSSLEVSQHLALLLVARSLHEVAPAILTLAVVAVSYVTATGLDAAAKPST